MRVLVVEDDPVIAQGVARALRREELIVDVVHDGEAGLREAQSGGYSLIVLDVMLPGRDGFSVCRELRRRRNRTPVLMLTAKDAVEDRVQGLEEGADDYLVKPFDLRELLARVRALLRRDAVQRTGRLQLADLVVDTRARTATRGGRELRLTPREYALLEALARNAGRILTREVVLESVWDAEMVGEGAVNFHVSALRKKLDGPDEPKLLHTVHGFGYVLRPPEDA